MKEPVMSFFAQSGTESVEAALKLARYVTGRGRFLGFLGGFHGRTMGSLSFTSSKYTQQKGFFPTMPGVTHVPYPNNYRPLLAGADQGQAVLKYIEETLVRTQRAGGRGGGNPDRADPGRDYEHPGDLRRLVQIAAWTPAQIENQAFGILNRAEGDGKLLRRARFDWANSDISEFLFSSQPIVPFVCQAPAYAKNRFWNIYQFSDFQLQRPRSSGTFDRKDMLLGIGEIDCTKNILIDDACGIGSDDAIVNSSDGIAGTHTCA